MDGKAQGTTLRLPEATLRLREGLVQVWRNRCRIGRPGGRRLDSFEVPDRVRMGRRDAQGRAPGQNRQMTLNVKTCSTGNSEEPLGRSVATNGTVQVKTWTSKGLAAVANSSCQGASFATLCSTNWLAPLRMRVV